MAVIILVKSYIAVASADENGADYTVTTTNGGDLASGTAPVGDSCPATPESCAG